MASYDVVSNICQALSRGLHSLGATLTEGLVSWGANGSGELGGGAEVTNQST